MASSIQFVAPIFCGNDNCYQYTGSAWINDVPPINDGYMATGVQFEDELYWKVGGTRKNMY